MTCINCMLAACRVKACHFPQDQEKIKKNLKEFRDIRGLRKPKSEAHCAETASSGITSEETAEG